MLLLCTLLGLATMHTLGHTELSMDSSGHGDRATVATTTAMDPHGSSAHQTSAFRAAPSTCSGDYRGHDPAHGGMAGWRACLAVLTGLATVLLALLLVGDAAHRTVVAGTDATAAVVRAYPPPGGRAGLALMSVAVLRI